MKTLALACVTLLIALLVAAAAPAPKDEKPVNLIKNGSFEEGPDPGDFKSLDEDSKDIKGWVVTRGQIDYVGTHWKAADGERSLDLHGSPGYGGVKQTFKTKKGQKYKLTFSLAANPEGTKVTSTSDMGWETKEWTFTADADETTLELHTLETDDPNCGPALDNVSVVAVSK
jgi:hypothetical protein